MGTEYDVERDSSPGGTQPHSLPKRCVAEQGGDALGGSALGAQSTITQMGHSDSPGSGSIVRDVLFEKSPYLPSREDHPSGEDPVSRGRHYQARLDRLLSPHRGLHPT